MRGEQKEDSDVDILVELDKDLDLVSFIQIKNELEVYAPDRALKAINHRISKLDGVIQEDKPWTLDNEKLTPAMLKYIVAILDIAYNLEFFLEELV